MSLPSEYGTPVAVVASNVVPVGGSVQAGQDGAAVNPILTGTLDGSGNLQPDQAVQNVELLASAARTADAFSASQINTVFRGLLFLFSVTQASGTGSLKLYLQGFDPVSGLWDDIGAIPLTVTSVGIWSGLWYPVSGGNPYGFTSVLPSLWRAHVVTGDGSSYTYSLSADLLK